MQIKLNSFSREMAYSCYYDFHFRQLQHLYAIDADARVDNFGEYFFKPLNFIL